MGQKTTRYVATITTYVYGETKEEAFLQAESQCHLIKDKFDCHASVEKFHKQPFGTMISEKLDIESIARKLLTTDLPF